MKKRIVDEGDWQPATKQDTAMIVVFFVSVGMVLAAWAYLVVSVVEWMQR